MSRLKMIESVESLTMASGFIQNSEMSHDFQWENLKYLKMKEFNCGIEKFFKNAKLKKLKLVVLKPQSLVTSSEFWAHQSQSLEELRILKCQIPFESLLTVITAGRLKKLELHVKIVNDNLKELLDALRSYKFHKITLKGLCKYSESTRATITNNPEVKNLKFINSTFDLRDEIIPHIHVSLPHITHLRLPLNYGIIPSESRVHFNSLTFLEIEAIKYPIHVQRMVYIIQKSPNLKILKVHWVGNHAVSDDLFTKILQNAANIKELSFGSKLDSFELSQEAIAAIDENCSERLKKLTTFTRDVENMRAMMVKLHARNIMCIALDKKCEAVKKNGDDRFSKFLMTDENKSVGRFIGTCTWSC
jgi:hypothetical protein